MLSDSVTSLLFASRDVSPTGEHDKKRQYMTTKKGTEYMRKYCEAILRVIELFCEGVYIKYMTEQKSENSLKSVRKITQEY